MKKQRKKKGKKHGILRRYLIFTGAVAGAAIFAGAFFTAEQSSEYITFGTEGTTVKSLISGYTQAQGIFTEPMENGKRTVIPQRAAEGLSYFIPAPGYGIYDLSVSVYEFGRDIAEAVMSSG